MELKPCPECGVPELITSEHLWLNNGDIVHARAQTSRMVFIETEYLDPLFRGIAQIIGSEIEHMIITTGRRAERIYLGSFVSEKVLEKIRRKELEYEPIDAIFRDLGRLEGVGNFALVDRRYEQDQNDYDTVSISEPHSVPMAVSAHIGAIEGLTGVDQGYRYENVSDDTYNVTAFPSPHPEELSKRMWFEPYHHRDGDIELEKCSTCGGPTLLGEYEWFPERGIIVNKITKRRIALQGDAMLNPVFLELEEELGDIVPGAVVEAQRRFTRSGFYTMEDITDEEGFRTQLALRSLGNLKELVMRKKGMSMRLDNAALHLITIGLAQGFFEIGFNVDTTVDWELSEDGDLQVEVKPVAYLPPHRERDRLPEERGQVVPEKGPSGIEPRAREDLLDLKPCPECGVPELITSEHQWLNNGDMVQRRAQSSRILFNETENLDPLFRGMAQIIGADIEQMIVTTARRAYRLYLAAFVPKLIREKIQEKELDYIPIQESFFKIGESNGSGRYEFVDRRYEGDEHDYNTIRITEPHSILMVVSAHLGTMEWLTGVEQGYSYEEVSPNVYEVTAFPSPHPKEMSKRMWFEPYHHQDGDVELERCGTCGGPKALSEYRWNPDTQVVANKDSQRRMAILGNALLDPVFDELQAELGDTIPRVVVEAQRRFTRSGLYTMDDIYHEGNFRNQLALRGLGNVQQIEMKRKGMNMHVKNVAMPLIVIGQAQGFFEMGFDVDTTVDWELSEEGDLQVEVRPLTYEQHREPEKIGWS